MSQTDLQIQGLDDEPGKVYIIGISKDMPEDAVDYMYSDNFSNHWDQQFDHAEYILIPGTIDSIVEFEVDDADDIKETLDDAFSRGDN